MKPGEFLLLLSAGPGFHPSNVMPLPFVWSHRTVGYMAIDSPKISSRWSHFGVPVSRMLLSLQQQLSSSSRTHGSWVIPFTLHISHIHSPEESIIRALMPGQNAYSTQKDRPGTHKHLLQNWVHWFLHLLISLPVLSIDFTSQESFTSTKAGISPFPGASGELYRSKPSTLQGCLRAHNAAQELHSPGIKLTRKCPSSPARTSESPWETLTQLPSA